ncbi:lipoate--protein ligase family protein [Thermoactinomyces mirandus]|uniref:Lipoate--protein ligase family protein n=1 Tax=Thermoactinomyces mirandus TaxID=2756294 RepID=A0A7W2APX0_9BACL|nr:biotin/lipoate A/B protein ligase family protein [Thermoactinomyces mirandus]MBA4600878.1 lipoate--protein ligase family protein [Thermoactinomyces mirandus]
MTTWRFLPYHAYTAAQNMAIDQAIMDLISEKKVPPTLRFYGWKVPTLSIGYFQKAKKEVNLPYIQEKGLGFVRRMTGGRAVLHDKELTYSVIVSEDNPSIPQTVSQSYRVISQGLLEGFRALGLDACLNDPLETRKENLSAACFDSPSDYELVIDGKKVAGSAQTRQRGVVLQHGSILLDLDEEMLFSLLLFPSEQVRERLKRQFSQKAVAINRILPNPVILDDVVTAFYEGFQKGMGITLEPGELTPEEKIRVQECLKERYETDEWNLRR